jgi:hypothetical protein
MNKAELYADIPYQILERNNLPFNYIELSLDQKEFVDYFMDDGVNLFLTNIQLQDKVIELEDKVADLEYELKDLAGEK